MEKGHLLQLEPLLLQHRLSSFTDFRDLDAVQVARLVVVSVVEAEFDDFHLAHGCDRLNEVAKHYGVDPAKIRAELGAAAKPPKDATRKEVIKKLPTASAPAKKAAPVKKAAPTKKAPVKKAAAKKVIRSTSASAWEPGAKKPAKKGGKK